MKNKIDIEFINDAKIFRNQMIFCSIFCWLFTFIFFIYSPEFFGEFFIIPIGALILTYISIKINGKIREYAK